VTDPANVVGVNGAPIGNDRAKKNRIDKKENVNPVSNHKGGNSTDYRAAKLKRDHPEVMALWREEMYGELGEVGSNQHTELGVSATKSSRQPDNTYWQARIRRDYPDITERMAKGE
jgi:hypothetical protein